MPARTLVMPLKGKIPLISARDATDSRNKSGLFKRVSVWTLLFFLGLLLGTAVFLPTQVLWERVVLEVDQRNPEIGISKEGVRDSGWTGARLEGVEISHAGRTYVLPVVRISLGLGPLLQMVVDTGPEMVLEVDTGKEVFLRGETDLARMVPDGGITGRLRADVHTVFESWDQPPVRGQVELESVSVLDINGDLRLEGLFLDAALRQEQLEILQLELEAPAGLECTGNVALDWSNLMDSTYRVQGDVRLGETSTPFEQEGRINDLL